MSNNNNKESWERDTLRMRPVRPESTDNPPHPSSAHGSGARPTPKRPQPIQPVPVNYDDDEDKNKAKLIIGIIAAIIVVLSLILVNRKSVV